MKKLSSIQLQEVSGGFNTADIGIKVHVGIITIYASLVANL